MPSRVRGVAMCSGDIVYLAHGGVTHWLTNSTVPLWRHVQELTDADRAELGRACEAVLAQLWPARAGEAS